MDLYYLFGWLICSWAFILILIRFLIMISFSSGLFFVLFIEECEIVRVLLLCFSFSSISSILIEVFIKHLITFFVFLNLIGWGSFSVTYADVRVYIAESCMILGLVFRSGLSWSVLVAVAISVDMGSCRSEPSLTDGVTTSALITKRWHFLIHFLPLAQMGAILHAVCLLNEKHVSMVLGSLHDFRSCSSVFSAHLIALVWLWRHRPICMSMRSNPIILKALLLHFSIILVTISSSESTKSRWVHLLLN